MQDVSPGCKRDVEIASSIGGKLFHLPAPGGQDRQGSLIRLIRTFLALADHRTHRTDRHLPLDPGIGWNLGCAGGEQEEEQKKDVKTPHDLGLDPVD